MNEQLGHTGTWSGRGWPEFSTRGGYRRNSDGRPVIHCEPLDSWRPAFGITVERWLEERAAGTIIRADLIQPFRGE